MGKRLHTDYTVLDEAAATGAGKSIYVGDFRHVVFGLFTSGSANATIQFAGSVAKDAPDFDSSQSPTNQWDYIEVVDLEDRTAIDGDTGVTMSGTDDNRQFEANVNALNWVTAEVSSYSAGKITVTADAYDNR